MKQVQADSQGKAKMGPGTLYGSIGRMMAAGLIRESVPSQTTTRLERATAGIYPYPLRFFGIRDLAGFRRKIFDSARVTRKI